MTDNEIIEAIRKATNDTFVGEYCESTCMGWVTKYDDQGRLLTTDPNYKTSYIYIYDNKYKVIRRGWFVWIIKSEYENKVNYLNVYSCPKEYLVSNNYIDLRPDYVKEYEKEQYKKCHKSEVEFKKYVKTDDGTGIIITKTKEDPDMPAYIFAKYIPTTTSVTTNVKLNKTGEVNYE